MLNIKNVDLSNLREISLYLLSSSIKNDYQLQDQIELFEKTITLTDNRNLSFIKELTNGTFKNLIEIDYYIKYLVKNSFNKLPDNILNILRIGIYQISYMTSTPQSAAVNESVNLAKKYGHQGTVKLVNGVLRNFIRKSDELKNSVDELPLKNKLSIKYSMPEWIIDYWSKSYSEQELSLLIESLSLEPDLFLRINTLKVSVNDFLAKLDDLQIIYEKTTVNETIKLKSKISIKDIYGYYEGFWYIQDLGASIVSKIVNPITDDNIIDFCGFPGGKTSHISALMNNTGKILVVDSSENRKTKFTENINRLGCNNIKVIIQSATDDIDGVLDVDKILIDPPCSGLGVIKRKVEIKYRKSMDDIKRLSELQYDILDNASKYLKSNGRIVYSTCTISKIENEDVITKFLDKHKDFKLETIGYDNKYFEYLNLIPHINNTDGFFIASLIKI